MGQSWSAFSLHCLCCCSLHLTIILTLPPTHIFYIFIFFYLTFSTPVISSHPFSFPLSAGLLSFVQEVSRCVLPPFLPLISQFCLSHTCKLFAVSYPQRGTVLHSEVSSTQQEVILRFCFSLLLFYCISTQMIHLSLTCSWSYAHTAATAWADGNWVSIVCVRAWVCARACACARACVYVCAHSWCVLIKVSQNVEGWVNQ